VTAPRYAVVHDGLAEGFAGTLMGAYRKIADASEEGLPWERVREVVEEEGAITVTVGGEPREYTIELRDDLEDLNRKDQA
jgi:hypothetical protein